MKATTRKSIRDEVLFVLIATIVLIALSFIIFPLFIALLPLVLISGGKGIWHLDHLKNNS